MLHNAVIGLKVKIVQWKVHMQYVDNNLNIERLQSQTVRKGGRRGGL